MYKRAKVEEDSDIIKNMEQKRQMHQVKQEGETSMLPVSDQDQLEQENHEEVSMLPADIETKSTLAPDLPAEIVASILQHVIIPSYSRYDMLENQRNLHSFAMVKRSWYRAAIVRSFRNVLVVKGSQLEPLAKIFEQKPFLASCVLKLSISFTDAHNDLLHRPTTSLTPLSRASVVADVLKHCKNVRDLDIIIYDGKRRKLGTLVWQDIKSVLPSLTKIQRFTVNADVSFESLANCILGWKHLRFLEIQGILQGQRTDDSNLFGPTLVSNPQQNLNPSQNHSSSSSFLPAFSHQHRLPQVSPSLPSHHTATAIENNNSGLQPMEIDDQETNFASTTSFFRPESPSHHGHTINTSNTSSTSSNDNNQSFLTSAFVFPKQNSVTTTPNHWPSCQYSPTTVTNSGNSIDYETQNLSPSSSSLNATPAFSFSQNTTTTANITSPSSSSSIFTVNFNDLFSFPSSSVVPMATTDSHGTSTTMIPEDEQFDYHSNRRFAFATATTTTTTNNNNTAFTAEAERNVHNGNTSSMDITPTVSNSSSSTGNSNNTHDISNNIHNAALNLSDNSNNNNSNMVVHGMGTYGHNIQQVENQFYPKPSIEPESRISSLTIRRTEINLEQLKWLLSGRTKNELVSLDLGCLAQDSVLSRHDLATSLLPFSKQLKSLRVVESRHLGSQQNWIDRLLEACINLESLDLGTLEGVSEYTIRNVVPTFPKLKRLTIHPGKPHGGTRHICHALDNDDAFPSLCKLTVHGTVGNHRLAQTLQNSCAHRNIELR